MFHSLKTLVFSVSFATASLAQADVLFPAQLTPGTGTWQLSADAQQGLSAAAITLSTPVGYTGSFNGTDQLNIAFDLVTMSGNHVAQRSATGPLFNFTRVAVKQGQTTFDATAAFSDVKVDLGSASIWAHVTGTDNLTHTTTDYGSLVIFSAQGVLGDDSAVTFQGPLRMSLPATTTILHIMGVPSNSSLTDYYNNTSWGTFSTSAVPEPQVNAMALLGLVGIALAVRRRRSA